LKALKKYVQERDKGKAKRKKTKVGVMKSIIEKWLVIFNRQVMQWSLVLGCFLSVKVITEPKGCPSPLKEIAMVLLVMNGKEIQLWK
jgi:hypothetical protein